ncbi:MAG: cell division protein FtsA [Bacilli bacterium]|nr:cell division protein FtsA [Bacilli bacterium]
MKKIYTSIDIGSDTIKILVGEMFNNKLNVLASSSIRSKGIKKGLIVDASEAIVSIREALEDIEGKLGVKIDKVIASVPAYFANFTVVDGYSTITNAEHKVYGDDIVRTLQACIYNKIPSGEELVTVMPIAFSIDNKNGIKDPKGVVGNKLYAKAVMITTPKKNIYSVVSAIESLGVEVTDINLGAIGDYYEYKNKDTDKCVGAVVNIGDQTTTVSLFDKGLLINLEVIQIGSKNIDNDLSYIYKLNMDESRRLKEVFAVANKHLAQETEVYELLDINKRDVSINQKELSEIVMSRLMEILKLAKKQTSLLTNKKISYIIITGGISEMPGLSSLIEEFFGKDIKIGDIETIGIRNNKYSTVSGMIKYFYDKSVLRGKEYSMFNNEKEEELISSKTKPINISNDSILGKVFGYFFDN